MAWEPLLYMVLAIATVVAAYCEGRRSRGSTADAIEAAMAREHEITLEQLGDALDNANATHEAALAIVQERSAVVAAFRTSDPARRHRMLLGSKDDPAKPTATSGGAEPSAQG